MDNSLLYIAKKVQNPIPDVANLTQLKYDMDHDASFVEKWKGYQLLIDMQTLKDHQVDPVNTQGLVNLDNDEKLVILSSDYLAQLKKQSLQRYKSHTQFQ